MTSRANPEDDIVAELLGRRPTGAYEVVVRRNGTGLPVVLANAPFLFSGRPMPTRYWLVDKALNKSIGRLESTGAIDKVEALVGLENLAELHNRYAAERDALLDDNTPLVDNALLVDDIPLGDIEHDGDTVASDVVELRPTGGVGGTRVGVKCLHAHYAYLLAGGDDPVGRWVHRQLKETGNHFPQFDDDSSPV